VFSTEYQFRLETIVVVSEPRREIEIAIGVMVDQQIPPAHIAINGYQSGKGKAVQTIPTALLDKALSLMASVVLGPAMFPYARVTQEATRWLKL
jgi:hypothetical protein